jgi:hypothetical protein
VIVRSGSRTGAALGPQTGLEEVKRDLLEADFWPGIISALPVTYPRIAIFRPIASIPR